MTPRRHGGGGPVVQALRRHDRAVAMLGRGRLADAERDARSSLAALIRLLGRRHPDVAGSWQTLAHVMHARGRMKPAAAACDRALALLAGLPPGDEELEGFRLQTMALRGAIERDSGRYGRAQAVLDRTVRLAERRLGRRHPRVAQLLVGLGAVLKFRGKLAAAGRCYRRALPVLQRAFGQEHPELASLYHNLAGLAHARGRFADAESWQRRSLALAERTADSRRIAADLAALAAVLASRRRPMEAEALFRRALRIHRRVHGPRHYEVAITLNNLAALLAATEQPARAERAYRRSLEAMRAAVGHGHPDVGLVLLNLGSLLDAGGRPGAARPCYRHALPILRRGLGPAHPDTRACAERLGGRGARGSVRQRRAPGRAPR